MRKIMEMTFLPPHLHHQSRNRQNPVICKRVLYHTIVIEQLKKKLSSSHAEHDDSLEYKRIRKLYYKSKVLQLTEVNSDLRGATC